MDKNFFLEMISQKPNLFNAIVEFNCKLLYEALLKLTQEVNHVAASVPGFNTKLTQKLALHAINLKKGRFVESGYCFWDFLDETRRLVLLDAEVINRMQLFFGTAVHSEAISGVLIRSDVLQLEELIGKDAYQYGLLRGRYQLGTVRHFFSLRDTFLPLPLRIQWHGRLALKICMSAWPQTLQERFTRQLKVINTPHDLEEDIPEEFPQAVVYGVWLGLKKILLREVAPQWTPYFD